MKRVLAFSLTIILFATNVLWAHSPETSFWAERQKTLSLPVVNRLPAIAPPQSSRSLSLNQILTSSYGSIRKIVKAGGNKTVIHIQDVHLNPEAQTNISQTLEELINQKKIDLVALEGAFGPMDYSLHHNYPHPKSVKAVAKYLFKTNKISGAVYTAYTNKNAPAYIGIDDRAHYDANVEAYKQSAPLVKTQKECLAALELALGRKKVAAFNNELQRFDAQVQASRQGKISWGEHIRLLSERVSSTSRDVETFLAALDQESKLDFNRVEAERTQLLGQLVAKLTEKQSNDLLNHSAAYKMGSLSHSDFYQYIRQLCETNKVNLSRFPAMDDYIRYVLLSDAVNVENVLHDGSTMENAVYNKLAVSAVEKELIDQDKQLYLAGKLIEFSLTSEEWLEYKKGMAQLKPFERFYEEAQLRDQAMSENLFKAMDKANAKVAVLVTGGFHSNGMNRRMKEAGITTIAFAPKISKIEEENGTSYLNVFTQEKTPLDKLFAGEKLFVTPAPDSAPVVLPVFAAHTAAAQAPDLTASAEAGDQVVTVETAPGEDQDVRNIHSKPKGGPLAHLVAFIIGMGTLLAGAGLAPAQEALVNQSVVAVKEDLRAAAQQEMDILFDKRPTRADSDRIAAARALRDNTDYIKVFRGDPLFATFVEGINFSDLTPQSFSAIAEFIFKVVVIEHSDKLDYDHWLFDGASIRLLNSEIAINNLKRLYKMEDDLIREETYPSLLLLSGLNSTSVNMLQVHGKNIEEMSMRPASDLVKGQIEILKKIKKMVLLQPDGTRAILPLPTQDPSAIDVLIKKAENTQIQAAKSQISKAMTDKKMPSGGPLWTLGMLVGVFGFLVLFVRAIQFFVMRPEPTPKKSSPSHKLLLAATVILFSFANLAPAQPPADPNHLEQFSADKKWFVWLEVNEDQSKEILDRESIKLILTLSRAADFSELSEVKFDIRGAPTDGDWLFTPLYEGKFTKDRMGGWQATDGIVVHAIEGNRLEITLPINALAPQNKMAVITNFYAEMQNLDGKDIPLSLSLNLDAEAAPYNWEGIAVGIMGIGTALGAGILAAKKIASRNETRNLAILLAATAALWCSGILSSGFAATALIFAGVLGFGTGAWSEGVKNLIAKSKPVGTVEEGPFYAGYQQAINAAILARNAAHDKGIQTTLILDTPGHHHEQNIDQLRDEEIKKTFQDTFDPAAHSVVHNTKSCRLSFELVDQKQLFVHVTFDSSTTPWSKVIQGGVKALTGIIALFVANTAMAADGKGFFRQNVWPALQIVILFICVFGTVIAGFRFYHWVLNRYSRNQNGLNDDSEEDEIIPPTIRPLSLLFALASVAIASTAMAADGGGIVKQVLPVLQVIAALVIVAGLAAAALWIGHAAWNKVFNKKSKDSKDDDDIDSGITPLAGLVLFGLFGTPKWLVLIATLFLFIGFFTRTRRPINVDKELDDYEQTIRTYEEMTAGSEAVEKKMDAAYYSVYYHRNNFTAEQVERFVELRDRQDEVMVKRNVFQSLKMFSARPRLHSLLFALISVGAAAGQASADVGLGTGTTALQTNWEKYVFGVLVFLYVFSRFMILNNRARVPKADMFAYGKKGFIKGKPLQARRDEVRNNFEKANLIWHIREQYSASEASSQLLDQVINNIQARQGQPSFDLANAIRVQPNAASPPELKKTFAIGLALAIQAGNKVPPVSYEKSMSIAFEMQKETGQLIFVNDEADKIKVQEALAAAEKYNKNNTGPLAVVGVIVTHEMPPAAAKAYVDEIAGIKNVPVAIISEKIDLKIENGAIPFTQAFARLALSAHYYRSDAGIFFQQLSIDNVMNKKVVVVGTSKTAYSASESLLSIMWSLVPVGVGYLMINLKAVLAAAKAA